MSISVRIWDSRFLSRCCPKPGEKSLTAAKQVLHCVKGAVDFGIRYTRDEARLLARDQKLNVLYGLSDSVEIKHMSALLFDWQCGQEPETLIDSMCARVDNAAAIAVAAAKNCTHKAAKHAAVKVPFLQACLPRGIIMIMYIKTCKNIADITTKQSVAPQLIA